MLMPLSNQFGDWVNFEEIGTVKFEIIFENCKQFIPYFAQYIYCNHKEFRNVR